MKKKVSLSAASPRAKAEHGTMPSSSARWGNASLKWERGLHRFETNLFATMDPARLWSRSFPAEARREQRGFAAPYRDLPPACMPAPDSYRRRDSEALAGGHSQDEQPRPLPVPP